MGRCTGWSMAFVDWDYTLSGRIFCGPLDLDPAPKRQEPKAAAAVGGMTRQRGNGVSEMWSEWCCQGLRLTVMGWGGEGAVDEE
jgi:hypothetical protein